MQAEIARALPMLKNPAVMIRGSGVKGGAAFSQMLAAGKPQGGDIDWGISYDSLRGDPHALPDQLLAEKAAEAAWIALDMADPPFSQKLCDMVNPVAMTQTLFIPNLSDINDALRLINSPLAEIHFVEQVAPKIALFFAPSIPCEVNERNRELILDALRAIAQNGTKPGTLWSKVSNRVIRAVSASRGFKPKHFATGSHSPRTNAIGDSLAKTPAEAQLRGLVSLIRSTGRPGKSLAERSVREGR